MRFASLILGVLAALLAARAASANTTTVVKPNGGECLTVGQTYTIEFSWSGANVEHIALYYRTDGQQPVHLDSSVIKHPINVPQQGTTHNWKPTSAHISETGRIWIDGHDNGHASLNIWDASNADVAVRSSCAVAAAADRIAQRRLTVPSRPADFETPAKVAEIIPELDGARLRFQVPWEQRTYFVRLIEPTSNLAQLTFERKELTLNPGSIVEFRVGALRPNTRYAAPYQIVGYDPLSLAESELSEITPPFWTLLAEPRALELQQLTATSAAVTITSPIANLNEGRTQVFFENITTATSSGWQSGLTWAITHLEPDTQYQVWAKARNGDGIESASSTPLTFRTSTALRPAENGIASRPASAPSPAGEPVLPELGALDTVLGRLTLVLQGFEQVLGSRRPISFLSPVLAPPPPPPPPERVGSALPRSAPLPPPAPKAAQGAGPLLPRSPSAPSQVERPLPLPAPALRRLQTFVVSFDGRGFQPQVLEIQVGDNVRWVNRSATPVWPASNPHPTHTGLPGFDALGEVFRQETYRIIFTRPGEFAYHNHLEAQAAAGRVATGIIRVTPASIPAPSAVEGPPPAPPLPEPGPPVLQPRVLPQPVPTPAPPPAPPPPPPPAPSQVEGPPAPTPAPPVPPSLQPEARPVEPAKTYVVVFAAGGFNPQNLTIRSGDTVRWINNTNQPVWPASDPHPTHTGLPGFDALGDLVKGESYRYTFRIPGTWVYHNHTVARAELEPEPGVVSVLP